MPKVIATSPCGEDQQKLLAVMAVYCSAVGFKI